MRRLPESLGLLSYWAMLVFTEAALLARPETAALAEPVTAEIGRFKELFGKQLGARERVIRASARAAVADWSLDEGVRDLHSDALGATRQRRDVPPFSLLFDQVLTVIIRRALETEVPLVEKIVERLGLSTVPAALREKHGPALSGLLGEGRAALKEHREAELAATEVRLEVQAWKRDVNSLGYAIFGQLLGLGSKQERTREWARSFFPPARPPKATPVPEDDDDEDGND